MISREEFKEKSCDGKHRFETEVQARRQAVSHERAGIGRHGGMNHYWCEFCFGWHAGHKPLWLIEQEQGASDE